MFKSLLEFTNLILLRLALLISAGFWVQASAQTVVTLSPQNPAFSVTMASTYWLDSVSSATPEQVLSGKQASLFKPSTAHGNHLMGRNASLWLHYRFKATEATGTQHQHWLLEFPQPLLDKVTVYQRSESGAWVTQTTGDTVAEPIGAEPGRYPRFRLLLSHGADSAGIHSVFVKVQSGSPITLEANVSTHEESSLLTQAQYLTIGLAIGAMLLVIVACINQSWVYRDPSFSWYAAYMVMLTLTVIAWTGIGSQMLWKSWGAWPDIAPGLLGCMTAAAALLVGHHLCLSNPRHRVFEKFILYLGFAGFAISSLVPFLDRFLAVQLVAGYIVLVIIGGTTRTAIAWRGNDRVALWVLSAFMPMAIAAIFLVGDRLGLLPRTWLSQYGVISGFALEIPLLLIALNLRTRERHTIEAREQTLTSRDALTGLLSALIFQDRLRQTTNRMTRNKEPAAVVYIKLVNYSYIKKTWGVAVSEQSLLRSVIKLRRILGDVDTIGRVGEDIFGLIMEGTSERSAVTTLAARLIAAGLMPLKGLKPEVILQFHVAAVLLSERPGTAIDITNELENLITNMGERTRRPIRFLEPELTRPMELGAQSEFEPEQTDPDRRADQQANWSI